MRYHGTQTCFFHDNGIKNKVSFQEKIVSSSLIAFYQESGLALKSCGCCRGHTVSGSGRQSGRDFEWGNLVSGSNPEPDSGFQFRDEGSPDKLSRFHRKQASLSCDNAFIYPVIMGKQVVIQ